MGELRRQHNAALDRRSLPLPNPQGRVVEPNAGPALRGPIAASSVNAAMRIHSAAFKVSTKGKGTYEITDRVTSIVAESEVKAGTVTVFVRHTSCSLIIMENADPNARYDLENFFEQLVPEDTPWFEHTAEGADDSTSHIRSVLTRSSEVIPIADGQVQLGTWQGIFLFEHRRAWHLREIALSVIGTDG
ncbi:MAG: secondary thiamine-phosphate synthase enzyme YjbQ [Chthoniobacterales bacterium]